MQSNEQVEFCWDDDEHVYYMRPGNEEDADRILFCLIENRAIKNEYEADIVRNKLTELTDRVTYHVNAGGMIHLLSTFLSDWYRKQKKNS